MVSLIVSFAGLSCVVLLCGIALAKSSDRLAKEFGLGGSYVGFLLLAGATSLPELVISAKAAQLGDSNMAVSDLLGSCLFNLLILGLLDLISRSSERMLSARSAAHGFSVLVTISLASLVGGGVLMEPYASLPSWWPSTLSFTSLALLPSYLIASRLVVLDLAISDAAAVSVSQSSRRWSAVAMYLAAAVVLFLVGPRMAACAITFADQSGLGGTFVGATFVAAVTSLPEAVTTYAALRIGAPDMAVGNVLGSNAFNLVMLGIVDLVSEGRLFAELATVHAVSAFAVTLVTAVAGLGLLYRAERTVGLIEPDAAAVVLLSFAGFVVIYWLS